MAHINSQIMAVFDVVRPPHVAKKLPLGQHLAGVGQQLGQQSKLYWRQMQIFPLAQHPAINQIYGDF
ncbi:hypothetical protein D3C81_2005210 [compost metagenome]